MNFTCDRPDLDGGLKRVAGAVQAKTPLDILKNVLLEAAGDCLRLAATDMELRIEARIPARVAAAGAVTLPARLFTELVGALAEKEVTIGTTEAATEAAITSGRSHFEIPVLSPAEFPALPEVGREGGFVTSQATLGRMIRQTVFAASRDDSRPALTGVLFELGHEPPAGHSLCLVTTDTHRLALRREVVQEGHGEGRLLVPGRTVTELRGNLDAEGTDPVQVQWDDNQIQFRTEQTIWVSRRLSGAFPNYQKIMPGSFSRRITALRDEMAAAVRRAEIVGREDSGRVILQVAGDQMTISAAGANLGRAREAIDITHEGDDIEIAFSARYLLDALGAMDAERITLDFTEPLQPAVMRPEATPGHLCLLMPMQLR